MTMITLAALVLTVIFALKLLEHYFRSHKVQGLEAAYVTVTGCDSGFGKELALRLDSAGFHVIATCMSASGCKSLKQDASNKLHALVLSDISDSKCVQKVVTEIFDIVPKHKGLWGLVNNAGMVGPVAPGIMSQKEDVLKVFSVNTCGPFEMVQSLLPLLRTARGRVVNASSINGRIICSQFLPYSISKYGVEAMSDILRRELQPLGIKVCMLEPGFFRTQLLGNLEQNIRESYWKAPVQTRDVFDTDFLNKMVFSFSGSSAFASKNISKVTDAYIHALTSKYPRVRYVIGWDALLLFLPLSFLPSCIQDFIVVNVMHCLGSDLLAFFTQSKIKKGKW